MKRQRCEHCRRSFLPSPRLKDRQEYCARVECQRTRKRLWARQKMERDPESRKNQVRAQRLWRRRNPGYWREYRKRNPAYTAENREKQKSRNLKQRGGDRVDVAGVANMDSICKETVTISGIYRLVPVRKEMVANMDSIMVEIRSVPGTYGG
jgi:hypothetical protein